MFSSLILKPRPLCVCKYFQDISRSSRPPCLAHVTEPGRSTPPSVPAPHPPQPNPTPPPFPFTLLSFILSVFSPWFPCTAADPVSVTRGDLEMITPDEPWMRGNLTTMPWELCRQARQASLAEAVTAASLLQSHVYHARRGLHAAAHSEMDLSAVALLMRYIVMSAQAEGAKQNDC